MQFPGLTPAELTTAGAHWTAREIAQQPQVWRKLPALAGGRDSAVARFLAPLLQMPGLRIVLTGAGSSAFVGECLAPAMTRQMQRPVAAVSTTDLVAGPANWLIGAAPTLLVSFARSGNSPESVAALEFAQSTLRQCHHLVVTCNAQGALREIAGRMDNAHVLLLPDESNDNGFAMTSSFSSMLLAAALAFGVLDGGQSLAVADAVEHILARALPPIQDLVRAGYERVIYLGANEAKGLAREAALKLLELTDGRVVSIADTPLGFRHGPKTVVNKNALVVVFLSADPYSRRYDLDLLGELRKDGVAGRVLALDAGAHKGSAHPDTIVVPTMPGESSLACCFPYLVFAQCLALMQSLALGIQPDNPNPSGMVNRVVKGVSIYPLGQAG
jgi:tagatose-6-phosphate ketose/aldose isomerase